MQTPGRCLVQTPARDHDTVTQAAASAYKCCHWQRRSLHAKSLQSRSTPAFYCTPSDFRRT
eukprot:3931756-Rhodomonas_salina.1